jgi:hypothetical protein
MFRRVNQRFHVFLRRDHRRRFVYPLLAVLGGLGAVLYGVALAQPEVFAEDVSSPQMSLPEGEGEGEDETGQVVEALAQALKARITVWKRADGRIVYSTHCRRIRSGTCEDRLDLFATWMVEAGRRHDVGPFLLAAMAYRESAFNPRVRGPAGSRGILQLHPRGSGARIKFIQNEAYRNKCLRKVGACQEPIVEEGASHLREEIERCGSLKAALGAYNRGHCGETGYTRRVLRERERLLDLAGLTEPPKLATQSASDAE